VGSGYHVRNSLPLTASEHTGRPPRVARVVALAHKLDALLHSGQGKDYGALARQSQVSPTRIAQILILSSLPRAHLEPASQDRLLAKSGKIPVTLAGTDFNGLAATCRHKGKRK